ncbi:MAG TPA: carbamoyl-phosphate synthase domain-containing protein, partial [Acidimicrobiia bacterium]|nr:carbamoyl-phosphate synthase domain-containing protein [Acidimicrobiia bacterium]
MSEQSLFRPQAPGTGPGDHLRGPTHAPGGRVTQALLVTADGTAFRGRSVGADGIATGEAVFNTSMTGYQEILTDPSYAGQVVVMTSPHQG